MDARLVMDATRPRGTPKGFLRRPHRPHTLPPWEGPPARDRYRDPLSNT
jgi:hypothetical protein